MANLISDSNREYLETVTNGNLVCSLCEAKSVVAYWSTPHKPFCVCWQCAVDVLPKIMGDAAIGYLASTGRLDWRDIRPVTEKCQSVLHRALLIGLSVAFNQRDVLVKCYERRFP